MFVCMYICMYVYAGSGVYVLESLFRSIYVNVCACMYVCMQCRKVSSHTQLMLVKIMNRNRMGYRESFHVFARRRCLVCALRPRGRPEPFPR